MAWVFANWWQSLILFYCSGVFIELLMSVVKRQISFANWSDMPWTMRFGIITGPFVWPLSYLSVFLFWKGRSEGVSTFSAEAGGFQMHVTDSRKSFHRILEALTEEYPPGEGAKHAFMLGDPPGSMIVVVHFSQENGVPPMMVGLTRHDLKLSEDDLFNKICDFVEDHSERYTAFAKNYAKKNPPPRPHVEVDHAIEGSSGSGGTSTK